MKKILVLAAALVLFAAAACAEICTYVETGTMDAEGKITENPDLADPRYLDLDDEAMTCAYGTEEDYFEGTYEVTEETDAKATLVATLTDTDPVTFTYDSEQDIFTATDAATGTVYVFEAYEDEETEEAADGDEGELHDRYVRPLR